MLVVQGYILKYGDTICGHPPVVKGAMMRNPNDGKIHTLRSNIPVYINKEYARLPEYHPDAYAIIFRRKDGVYANIYFDLNDCPVSVEELKQMKLGCFASDILYNKDGDVVDGYIRYIQMGAEGNVEPIDRIAINVPFKEPDIIFERKDENENEN